MTITCQALSLVERAEPVHVCFTLRLRDHRSMWMQDGSKVYVDSYVASNGSCVHGHLDYFPKQPLGGRPNTNRETMALQALTALVLFYFIMMWGPAWIEIHWNSIWLRVRSHMAWHYTWGSVTTLHDFGGAFGHFLLGSHNFMAAALGSCVKWPLVCLINYCILRIHNTIQIHISVMWDWQYSMKYSPHSVVLCGILPHSN